MDIENTYSILLYMKFLWVVEIENRIAKIYFLCVEDHQLQKTSNTNYCWMMLFNGFPLPVLLVLLNMMWVRVWKAIDDNVKSTIST